MNLGQIKKYHIIWRQNEFLENNNLLDNIVNESSKFREKKLG